MYKINMNYKTSEAEIQVTQDILDFFNENPEMMNQAAQKTIQDALSGITALAQGRKEDISSGKAVYPQIRRIDSMMGTQVDANHLAMKGMMIARWINQNFEQMDEVEKYVSYYKYLRPIVNQDIHRIGPIQTDGDDAGKPDYFDQEVRGQLIKMGASSTQVQSRKQDPIAGRMGAPRPAGEPSNFEAYDDDVRESIEEQIDRIERLLKEQEPVLQEKDPRYDLRLYSMRVDVSMQKDLGGEIQETQTEIRGIEGVTTVRTVGDTQNIGRAQVGTYEIKFELIGSQGRVQYRDRVLIPGLMKIKGLSILRVSPMHRTNVRGTVRNVRESKPKTLKEYGGVSNFGGLAGGLGFARLPSSAPMRTPRKMISQVIDDWVEGGVMDYDVPMNTNDSSYHVMVPVEELLPYIGREFRAPKDAFDGMYQHFIEYGAQNPVYLAIGKNGRAKITGNEDVVWYAKKAGLDEVPVFFSYQAQV
jgi:hypothetical protein